MPFAMPSKLCSSARASTTTARASTTTARAGVVSRLGVPSRVSRFGPFHSRVVLTRSSQEDNLDKILGGTADAPQEPQEPEKPEKPEYTQADGELFLRKEMSMEQKKKLRDEYVGFGGGPNTKMGGNYFLWISVFIGTCAILSKLTGAI